MNEYVTFDELTHDMNVQPVEVNLQQMKTVNAMSTSDDPVTKAGIELLLGSFDVTSLELESSGLSQPSVFEALTTGPWQDMYTGAIVESYKFGVCVYKKIVVSRDCSVDERWAKANPGFVERNDTIRQFAIPVVMPYGTYRLYVFPNEIGLTKVVALPVEAFFRDRPDPLQTLVRFVRPSGASATYRQMNHTDIRRHCR